MGNLDRLIRGGIAIVAIVAIVALAFTMVYASGGFKGTAYQVSEGAAYKTLGNDDFVIMDWNCFKQCLNTAIGVDICKETCRLVSE